MTTPPIHALSPISTLDPTTHPANHPSNQPLDINPPPYYTTRSATQSPNYDMQVWDAERKLEKIANRFYKEQRRIDASLLTEDTTLLNALRKEYQCLAYYHNERWNALGHYHYYVI